MKSHDKLAVMNSSFRRPKALVLLYATLSMLAGLAFPLVVERILSSLTTLQDDYVFFRYCLYGLALVTIDFFLNWLQNYKWHNLGKMFVAHLRKLCFAEMLGRPFVFFKKHDSSDLVNRIINDADTYGQDNAYRSLMFILNVAHIIGVIAFMSFIEIRLSALVVLYIPLYYLYCLRLNIYLRKTSIKEREAYSDTLGTLQEKTSAVEAIKINQRESFFIKAVNVKIDSLFNRAKKLQYYKSLGTAANSYFISLLPLIVLAAGGYLITRSYMTVPAMLAFYLYIPSLREPINNLTDWNLGHQSALAVKERLNELFGEDTQINNGANDNKNDSYISKIVFNNVGFSYNNNDAVLTNVSFSIEPGDRVLIKGTSGSGKTTLLRLLLGLEQATSGSISINNQAISRIDHAKYLGDISYMSQFPFLFTGSALENLQFDIEHTNEQISLACQISRADRFLSVNDLSTTLVALNGDNFSGGEKQRIALARTILKNAGVIILDEPTSSLDKAMETEIVDGLKDFINESPDTMLLVISHGDAFDKICNKTVTISRS